MLLLISGYISWYKIWIQFFFWCISMPICWKSSYSCLDIVLPPLPVLSYLRDLDESCNLYAKNMLICTVNLWFAFLGDMILGPVWDHFPLRVLCLDWNWREDWGAQCMFSKFRWPDYWWRSWWTPKGCRPSAGIVIIIFWLGKGGGIGTHFFELRIVVFTITPNAHIQLFKIYNWCKENSGSHHILLGI